ncbi:calcium:proton antiporter, partial [Pseudomonas sp. SIMBA_077]
MSCTRFYSRQRTAMLNSLKQEKFLLLALLAAVAAYPLEHLLLGSGQGIALGAGLVLIGFIVM